MVLVRDSLVDPVAEPDFAQPVYLPSVISSFFTQNKEGARAPRAPWAPLLDPPLCSLPSLTGR